MRAPTLRQMRIFTTVGEHGSLATAGRTLGLSPATLSDAIRDLECSLGKEVFDRSGRALRLSSVGKAFLPDANRILREMDLLMQRYSRSQILRIGASVTVGNYILPPIISDYSLRNGTIEMIVQIRNTEDILKLLLHHDIEAAVVEGLVSDPDLEVRAWRNDPLVIVAAPAHPLACSTDLGELARGRWIAREHGSGTRQSFDAIAAGWPSAPRVALTVSGNEILKTAVKQQVGLGCISRSAVDAEVVRGELVIVPMPGTPIMRTLSIVQRRKSRPQDALMRFLDQCFATTC